MGSFGPIFITVSMPLFDFTPLVGNYDCEGCLRFIFKRAPSKTFMTAFWAVVRGSLSGPRGQTVRVNFSSRGMARRLPGRFP